MKTRIYFLSLVLLSGFFTSAYAQTAKDSVTFVNAKWKSKCIHMGGITLRQCAFTDDHSLFNSNQFISVLEIRNSFRFDVVADTALITTADFVKASHAMAGINGSFFALDAPWHSVDYLRVDTVEIAPNRLSKEGQRLFHQEAALTVSVKGRLGIHKAPEVNPTDSTDWESALVAEDVLTSGPLLRYKGMDQILDSTSFVTTRHPRTAVALRKGGRVLLVVVDGRAQEAAGMSLPELQAVLRWLRAYDAVNFDGGGSSTLCVRKNTNKPVEIVNHPCDNRVFDKQGARRVANALVVK